MTTQEIADLVAAQPGPRYEAHVQRVSDFAGATNDAIVFAQDQPAVEVAVKTAAGLILVPLAAAGDDPRMLRVRSPKYAFALCGHALVSQPAGQLIHPSAVIDLSATIGDGTRIGPGAVIEAGVIVGASCTIGSRVTLCQGVQLGDRVIVQSGAVLGSTGFGYVRNAETGEHILFPQQGDCVIEDDVEIGANTTIDRGALGETRIGRGTKIDNLVHIAHNCVIGRNVIIAAQVGISGSCVVEDGAVIAGQVGLGDHVRIGKGVILGGSAGVFPHKHVEGPGQMFMGIPAEPLKDYLKTIARVRRLK